MSEDDEIRLRHMLDAARDIQVFSQGRTRDDLDRDRQLRFAIVKCLEIVGEAASRMSLNGQANVPDLPWVQIIGMRNRMIHGYYDINLDIVWATVQSDIPRLIQVLDKILVKGS